MVFRSLHSYWFFVLPHINHDVGTGNSEEKKNKTKPVQFILDFHSKSPDLRGWTILVSRWVRWSMSCLEEVVENNFRKQFGIRVLTTLSSKNEDTWGSLSVANQKLLPPLMLLRQHESWYFCPTMVFMLQHRCGLHTSAPHCGLFCYTGHH